MVVPNSTVLESLTHIAKNQGSNPTTGTEREEYWLLKLIQRIASKSILHLKKHLLQYNVTENFP